MWESYAKLNMSLLVWKNVLQLDLRNTKVLAPNNIGQDKVKMKNTQLSQVGIDMQYPYIHKSMP